MELPPRTPLPAGAVPGLDELCLRTANRLGSPVALISLVDTEGQALPGAFGLAEPWMSERWTPLTHSFCQHVVTSGEPFVVANAHDDPLVKKNLAIMELGVIAYAGVPLVAGDDGQVVGRSARSTTSPGTGPTRTSGSCARCPRRSATSSVC